MYRSVCSSLHLNAYTSLLGVQSLGWTSFSQGWGACCRRSWISQILQTLMGWQCCCIFFFSSPPTLSVFFQDLVADFTKVQLENPQIWRASFRCLCVFSWARTHVRTLSAWCCRALITPSLCYSGWWVKENLVVWYWSELLVICVKWLTFDKSFD